MTTPPRLADRITALGSVDLTGFAPFLSPVMFSVNENIWPTITLNRVTCCDLAHRLRHFRAAPGSMIGQRSDRMIRAADRSMSNLLPQTATRTNNLAHAFLCATEGFLRCRARSGRWKDVGPLT
jgi:hypothetical protein